MIPDLDTLRSITPTNVAGSQSSYAMAASRA